MTVFDLIRELCNYPPDTEVIARIKGSRADFDIDGTENEFHVKPLPKHSRVVIVIDSW